MTTYYVDKTFLSCKSVHLEHGLSDSNEQQAIVKKQMIEIAGQTILLADSSKFGKRAFATITDLGVLRRSTQIQESILSQKAILKNKTWSSKL